MCKPVAIQLSLTTKLPPMSFEGVTEEWLKRDQAGNRSYKSIEGRFRNYVLPAWKGRLITDIDRRACLDLIDTIADTGKVILARRVFGHLYRLFAWSIGRGIIEINPLQHAEKPGAEVARDRVLSDAELVKVWNAAENAAASVPGRLQAAGADGCPQAGDQRPALGRRSTAPTSPSKASAPRPASRMSSRCRHRRARSWRAVGAGHPTFAFPTEWRSAITNWGKPKMKLDKHQRRHRLDDPRHPPNGRHRPPEAWRAAASDRGRPGPHQRIARRHRRHLPEARLRSREGRCPGSLGRSRHGAGRGIGARQGAAHREAVMRLRQEGRPRRQRAEAGNKLRFRYEPGKAFDHRAFRIGQLCETLWRADDKRGEVLRVKREELRVTAMRLEKVGTRPRTRKQIISYVAKKVGETHKMVERCWDDYRDRWEPDLVGEKT